jgi:hypothetical protein
MFQNASSLKPLGQLKPNCPGMIIGRTSTKFMFFMSIGNPRWPPPQYIDLHWIHMGKCSIAFFSETTNIIGHLGFTIGIKNKKIVEDLPMIIPGQFGFNCPSGFREEAF